jgi:hypothetical protein
MLIPLRHHPILPYHHLIRHTHLLDLCLVQWLDDLVPKSLYSRQSLADTWDGETDMPEPDTGFRVVVAGCVGGGVGGDVVEFEETFGRSKGCYAYIS